MSECNLRKIATEAKASRAASCSVALPEPERCRRLRCWGKARCSGKARAMVMASAG